MRTRLLALCLLGVTIIAAPSRAADWVLFHCKAGNCSVSMPTDPSVSERTYPSFMGDIKTHVYTSQVESCIFALSYTDVPSLAVGFARGKTFSSARDNLLSLCGGQMVSFQDLKFGREHAKELVYQIPAHAGEQARRGRSWFILVVHQLIVVDGVCSPTPAQEKLVERYLTSLKTESDQAY